MTKTFGTDGDFIEPITVTTAGTTTYTVTVDPQGASTGSVTVTYYVVPANATATAPNPLTIGTPGQNGVITFSVTGAAADRTFTVSTTVPADPCCVDSIELKVFQGRLGSVAPSSQVRSGYTFTPEPRQRHVHDRRRSIRRRHRQRRRHRHVASTASRPRRLPRVSEEEPRASHEAERLGPAPPVPAVAVEETGPLRRLFGLAAMDIGPLRRHRDYRLLFAGQAFSFFGSMVTFVAVPYQVYQLTGSSLAVGLLSLAALAPLLVTAFIGGAFADAVDRRRMLQIAELGLGIAVVAFSSTRCSPSRGCGCSSSSRR